MQVLIFGEAKKSKYPVGTRRMVKATSKANYKAPTFFQAASTSSPKGSLAPLSKSLIEPCKRMHSQGVDRSTMRKPETYPTARKHAFTNPAPR